MGSTRIKQAYGSLKCWLVYEAHAQFWLTSQPTQCVSGRVRWFALATSILAFTKVIKVRCVIGRPIARNHRAQALAITSKSAKTFERFRPGDSDPGRSRSTPGRVSRETWSVSRPESAVPNLVPLEQRESKAQMHLVCGRNSDRQSAASFRWKAHLP